MDNRNVVKKHIESLFQVLDETKRSSSSPVANFFWNRINSFKSSTEINISEKLKQISQYIEALEKNIAQQENTITNSNKDIESIKSQLKQALTENTNLKTSFNRKIETHTQLLKEKDENLMRLTAQMQNLQQELDEIRQLYKDSKAENKSTKTVPELNSALEEFKVTQLKEFAIIFREFENEISNSWIEKMEHVGNTLQKAVEATQQTYSSNNHEKTAHLNGSFRKGSVPIKVNNKVMGDKEEID